MKLYTKEIGGCGECGHCADIWCANPKLEKPRQRGRLHPIPDWCPLPDKVDSGETINEFLLWLDYHLGAKVMQGASDISESISGQDYMQYLADEAAKNDDT